MLIIDPMAAEHKPIYGSLQYPQTDCPIGNNPHMDISKVIAANLSDWMTHSPNLDTIKKLAAKSGVGFGTVQRAKNGDGNITAQNLEAIAMTFGRHAVDLLADNLSKGLPARIAEEPSARNYHVSALLAAVERLSPEDARTLLPVVTRIADSQVRSTARRRGASTINFDADDTPAAASR